MKIVEDIWRIVKRLSQSEDHDYSHHTSTKLLELLSNISKGKKTQVWDDDDIVIFLTGDLKSEHPIWKSLEIRPMTRFGRQIQKGLYRPLAVESQGQVHSIVVKKPYGSVKLIHGHEAIHLSADGPTSQDEKWVEVYRNAQNRTTWGVNYHTDIAGYGRHQGSEYPDLVDVVAGAIQYLIGGDRSAYKATAQRLISEKLSWEPRPAKVPEDSDEDSFDDPASSNQRS